MMVVVVCGEVEGKAVAVEGGDVAVVQNIAIGSCAPRPRILAWWLLDVICDLTAFIPIQVILIVFLQTWQ
jgi:hypothetical protein